MQKVNKEKKERVVVGRELIDLVFTWSIKDVLNNHIYKNQVKQIPRTFSSTTDYLKAFTAPLVEETRADLSSSITTLSHSLSRQIQSIKPAKGHKPPKDLFYNLVLKPGESDKNVMPYEPGCGDLIAITSVRPKGIDDLERFFAVAYVQRVKDDRVTLSVLLSKPIFAEGNDYRDGNGANLFATYLINMTTNVRIWQALASDPKKCNTKVIEKVLQNESLGEDKCTVCRFKQTCSDSYSDVKTVIQSSDLNESQQNAVFSCIGSRECHHQSTVKLIWGPPGTGKTKTVGFLLHSLLRMKRRTLTCAPTNIAVLEVTERLVTRVTESNPFGTYGLGDVVLFGNGERMKIENRGVLCDVFLDHRIDVLDYCLASETGWKNSLLSMISLLEDPWKQHCLHLEDKGTTNSVGDDSSDGGNARMDRKTNQEEENISKKISKEKETKKAMKQAIIKVLKENKNQKIPKDEKKENDVKEGNKDGDLAFEEFIKRRFAFVAERLYFCIVSLYTHLPTSLISPEVVKMMFEATESLKSFQKSLSSIANEEFKQVFVEDVTSFDGRFRACGVARRKSLFLLKLLPLDFPVPHSANSYAETKEMGKFLLANACLIFCTVSSSAKLNTKGNIPLEYLVIDEAAQLKECESAIPLQLPGIRHAVLIGDERQLPAMVKSKVAEEADFGRSLFERLTSLGFKKHLLNVQHRMHPSISLFPNREFYENKILDGQNVRERSYNENFLPGKMFGAYSFINVAHGNEVSDNKHSTKNMVEVSVVSEIIASIYKEVKRSKKKVRVGVISPYKAQVQAICERLGKQYSSDPENDFSVSVRSVDGFQGGEEDIIIISTVRSNGTGLLGFLSNRQRANVALTRARHCLWIVGNGETLGKRRSVWKKLISDAKERCCFHNASEDKNLAWAIVASLVKLNQINASPKLVSLLFREGKWKVCFDDAFWGSMARVKDYGFCKEVLSLIDKLSCGWHQKQKENGLFLDNIKSSEFIEYYKVKQMYLVWAVDTLREASHHIQVIKVWNVVKLHDLPRLSKEILAMYESYSSDKMTRCKYRHKDEDLVVPISWAVEAEPVELLSNSLTSLSLRT